MGKTFSLISQSSWAEHEHAIEAVRVLSDEEVQSLEAARGVLARATSNSSYYKIVTRYESVSRTVAQFLTSSNYESPRLQNALLEELRSFSNVLMGFSEELRDASIATADIHVESLPAEDPQHDTRISFNRMIAEKDIRVSVVRVESNLEAVLQSDHFKSVRLTQMLDSVMYGVSIEMANFMAEARPAIDDASRSVRLLASEVLYGTPAIAEDLENAVSGKSFPMKELPLDLVQVAQRAVRDAERFLRDKGQIKEGLPTLIKDELTDDKTESANGDHVANEQPQIEESRDLNDEESSPGVPRPPIDISMIVAHLLNRVTEAEKTYGALPDLASILKAWEQDKALVGSLMRQVQRSIEQGSGRSNGGVQINFPPLEEDLIGLNQENDAVRLRSLLMTEVLSIKTLVDILDAPHSPRELIVDASTREVKSAIFDITGPTRVKGWVRQVGRVSEHRRNIDEEQLAAEGSSLANRNENELKYLAVAASDCFLYGFYEAALLYASAFDRRSGNSQHAPEVQEAAIATIRRIAEGNTIENLGASGVLLILMLVTSLETRQQLRLSLSHPEGLTKWQLGWTRSTCANEATTSRS